ncbi:hypothetical protein M0657_000924 [Pyricularia oryzae]|uniref:Uncharacterized protein n=2 Tax=Pyricularia oryzae TaxID=318829 RepID=A0AA97P4L5_PYRO3|nr:hypothetical protein OOU_Y34scaffold00248g20 [Pyricularia oryzae Y34]KAI7931910.1 hypothetical protein M0657_000924 [Pyricularia oryzae]
MLDCDGNRPSDQARMAKLVDQGLSNPPECLSQCAKAAITRMLPKGLPFCGETTVDICTFLEVFASPKDLWALYWCDSTFCGVANQQPRRLGQDHAKTSRWTATATVNRVINQCQNLGRRGLVDPGPPPEGYTCSFYIDEPFYNGGRCDDAAMTALADPVADVTPPRSTATTDAMAARLPSSAAESTSFLVLTTSVPAPSPSNKNAWLPLGVQPSLSPTWTASASTPPSTSSIKPNAASDSSKGGGSPAAAAQNDRFEKPTAVSQGQLSIGGVAAIAVCVPVTLVILGFLACYLWRRKRSRKTDSFQGSLLQAHLRHNQHHAGRRTSAATAKYLISNANVNGGGGSSNSSSRVTRGRSTRPLADIVPLSPPPRLRDRKYLQSIFKRAESPPLTPLGPAEGDGLSRTHTPASRKHVFWDDGGGPGSPIVFPTSPICSPTVSRLEPRREHTPSLHPTSPVSNPFADHEPQLPPRALASAEHRRASGGSVGSGAASARAQAASSLRNEYVPLSGISGSRRATNIAQTPQANTPPPSPARPPRPHEEKLEIPNLLAGPLAASPQVADGGFKSPSWSPAAARDGLGIRGYAASRSSERIPTPLPRYSSGPGYRSADTSPLSSKSDTFPTRYGPHCPTGLAKTSEQLRGEARALWEHTESCAREARDAPKVDERTIAAEAAALQASRPVFDLSERNSWSSLNDLDRMKFCSEEPRLVGEGRK